VTGVTGPAAARRWRTALTTLLLATSMTACGAGDGGNSRDGGGTAAGPGAGGGGAAQPVGGTGYGPPALLGRLAPSVDESSGLAASRRNPGLVWTHNDSGDDPLVYCADRQARSCGTWLVTGAAARDWEDMAVGPGPEAGRSYLYLGDIGDNLGDQGRVAVYRVPEPAAPAAPDGRAVTERAERIPLRYADGPHDAEALLVHPVSGDLYVVTKEPSSAGVYRMGTGGVLERIATLAVGSAPVTGADIAPDGRRVALCTYSSGFELELPPGAAGFDDVWRQPLRPVDLGPRAQGEAVAYRLDGNALLSTSEMAPAPLQEVERRAH